MNHTVGIVEGTFVQVYSSLVSHFIPEFVKSCHYTPWIFSLLGSFIIGLSGVLPLIIIPTDEKLKSQGYKDPGDSKLLRILLSFAVGGLLGDVFLHLLPEAWEGDNSKHSLKSGLWVLLGILMFTVIEKVFSDFTKPDEKPLGLPSNTTNPSPNGKSQSCSKISSIEKIAQAANEPPKKVAGYLNLLANSIDNFTHGLAVAGSFLVSFRHGVLATFAILLHEIPHEVGDFAILLRSGFNRWDAAKAQLLTASAGLLGAMVAIGGSGVTSAMEARTSWIMPFTAGGFLHIALVTVLPDILKEENKCESFKQLVALVLGVFLVGLMTILFEHH